MSERLKVKQVRRQIQFLETRIVRKPAIFKHGEIPVFCHVCEVKSQRRCRVCGRTARGQFAVVTVRINKRLEIERI